METTKYYKIKNLEKLTLMDYSLIKTILDDNKKEIIDKLVESESSSLKINVCSESKKKINEFIEYYFLDEYFDKIKTNFETFYIDLTKLSKVLSYDQIKSILTYLYDYINEFSLYAILRQLNLI